MLKYKVVTKTILHQKVKRGNLKKKIHLNNGFKKAFQLC